MAIAIRYIKFFSYFILIFFLLLGMTGSGDMPEIEVSETKMPFYDEEGNEHMIYELFTFTSPTLNRSYSVFLPLPPSPWARDGISFSIYDISYEEWMVDVSEEDSEILWKATIRYYEEKKAKDWKGYRSGKTNPILEHVNEIKFP